MERKASAFRHASLSLNPRSKRFKALLPVDSRQELILRCPQLISCNSSQRLKPHQELPMEFGSRS